MFTGKPLEEKPGRQFTVNPTPGLKGIKKSKDPELFASSGILAK